MPLHILTGLDTKITDMSLHILAKLDIQNTEANQWKLVCSIIEFQKTTLRCGIRQDVGAAEHVGSPRVSAVVGAPAGYVCLITRSSRSVFLVTKFAKLPMFQRFSSNCRFAVVILSMECQQYNGRVAVVMQSGEWCIFAKIR